MSITMTTSSTSKYHPKNIVSSIGKAHMKCNKIINSNKHALKLMNELWDVKPEVSMANFIISSFNNYVNDENKFMMFSYIEKFNKVFVSKRKNWEKKLINYLCICVAFVKDTLKFTGINFIARFSLKGEPKGEENRITNDQIYNLLNNFKPVVMSHQLNHNTFAMTFLNNVDAKDVHNKINNMNLVAGDDCKYDITTSYIEPLFVCRSINYQWGQKNHTECVMLPFKKPFVMTMKRILDTCKYFKHQHNEEN